jgi:hypothetical protein
VNRTIVFLILLFSFHTVALGNESNPFQELAIKYAGVVGDVELGNVTFSEINKRCKTQFEFSSEFLLEVDFYLRRNTGYTYKEFVQFMKSETETVKLANQLVDELIQQNGGCNTIALEHWFNFVTNNDKEVHLVFLRENESLFGLPKVVRTNDQLVKNFSTQLKKYKSLPYKELFELASALEHGSYSYSMFGLTQSIKIDKEKSLELWKFAAKKFNEPQAYYYIGKLLQTSSTADAFLAFEQSAKQGYKFGEIWLGTYYACNKDNIKAKYWLEIAKQGYKDPDYIDDIYAEINDLGMPTNCLDGWVY